MNFYNHYQDPEFYIKRQKSKDEIKKLGFYTGLALIFQIVIQNGLSIGLDIIGLLEKYDNDGAYQNAIDIILVVAGLIIPFYFIGKKMKDVSGISEPVPLNKPCNMSSFFLAVVAGTGLCMLASIITSYLTVFINLIGIELTAPDIPMPTGTTGIITSVLRVVVIAAVSEEICLRGYVMGNLRKYGDRFALLVSASVFAIIHGNLIQAPFALIAGFTIGYFTIKTGTLWTGIAIHGANNLISTVFSYLFDFYGEEKIALVYTFFIYGLIVIGIIAVKAFNRRNINIGLYEDPLAISTAEKVKAFFLNPAMIIAMAYMLYITSLYVGINF
jgi:membrane protease YdiL (CAAX protease family)